MAIPIKFYDRNKPFYQFTNFYIGKPILASFPLEIRPDGIIIEKQGAAENPLMAWTTSEMLFQACKFIEHPNIVGEINNCGSSRNAFNLARKYKSKQLPYWFDVNVEVMRWVLEQKFQDEELKKILLETGDAEIIEDTENDMSNVKTPWFKDQFWGNATKYDKNKNCLNIPGDNKLGKLLMELREKIKLL